MTTANPENLPTLAAVSQSLLGSLRDELPSVMVDTRKVDGFRHPQWVARKLLPGESVDLQGHLVQLDLRLRRAREGKTLELVSRLLNLWKNDRTDDEKDWQFEDWAEDLEEFSAAHLQAACQHWRRTQHFPPKIAEIRALCEHARLHDMEMHRRARVLLGLEEPRAAERLPAPHKPITLNHDQRALLATVSAQPEEKRTRKA